MARKFFITGGTGLIGRALVRLLIQQRGPLNIERLTLLTRSPERLQSTAPDIANAEVVVLLQGDMTSSQWPRESFTDLIHGATDVNDLLVTNRLEYAWSIAEGTKRTLDYAAQSGCERYLYLSSGAVYGPGPYPESGIPENWSTAPALDSPATAYGQAKRFSEHLCTLLAERSSMAVRIARIFSVIGPESPLDGQYALGNFIREAVSPHGDSIRIKGDGTATRSYLHVDDLARWLLALNEKGPRCATYNLGAAREVSIRELAEAISKLSERKKPVIVEGKLADYGGRARYYPDTRGFRHAMSLDELHTLEGAIGTLLAKAKEEITPSSSSVRQ
ncbi:NAD-dependent epimerase/dehydratase family protein [Solimonas flava]|uniref:NAD-dependent epimerase/dehydratase family protein n=1 Tax=Solimonas flava TaxID=415849 RepID=UPI00040DBF39|nr:NAD(P)-dependent oxidoreductase [Solimonas flava]